MKAFIFFIAFFFLPATFMFSENRKPIQIKYPSWENTSLSCKQLSSGDDCPCKKKKPKGGKEIL